MRTSKASQQTMARGMRKRAQAAFDRADQQGLGGDNVALYMPDATDYELELLREHFSKVERGFLGYVRFERSV